MPITKDPKEFASDHFLGDSQGDLSRFVGQPQFNRIMRKADPACVVQGYMSAETQEYIQNMYRPARHANLRVEKPWFALTHDDNLKYSISDSSSDRLPLGFWILLLTFFGAIIWVFTLKGLIPWPF
jgi:hypothetical protein